MLKYHWHLWSNVEVMLLKWSNGAKGNRRDVRGSCGCSRLSTAPPDFSNTGVCKINARSKIIRQDSRLHPRAPEVQSWKKSQRGFNIIGRLFCNPLHSDFSCRQHWTLGDKGLRLLAYDYGSGVYFANTCINWRILQSRTDVLENSDYD